MVNIIKNSINAIWRRCKKNTDTVSQEASNCTEMRAGKICDIALGITAFYGQLLRLLIGSGKKQNLVAL